MRLRVFQGLSNQGGQAYVLSKAFKKLGHKSLSVTKKENNYNYPSDLAIDLSQMKKAASFEFFYKYLDENFDIFHFHASTIFNEQGNEFPTFQDIILLKLMGKKVFFHFRGSEARISEIANISNPYSIYKLKTYSIEMLKALKPDKKLKETIQALSNICDGLFAVDAEVARYIPNSIIVPRAHDFSEYNDRLKASSNNRVPVVVHAPSNEDIKGTKSVLVAVDLLKKEGIQFEFKMLKGFSNHDVLRELEKADVLIDQLRIGWYGVLSVEAMARSVATLCYIKDDLKNCLPENTIYCTSIETLVEDLRTILCDPSVRSIHSEGGHNFCRKYHCSISIAKQLEEIYTFSSKKDGEFASGVLKIYSNQIEKHYVHEKDFVIRILRSIKKLVFLFKVLSLNSFFRFIYLQIKRKINIINSYFVKKFSLLKRGFHFLKHNGIRRFFEKLTHRH